MTVVFVSNYINHHQIPFSNAMYEHLKEDYYFVQTEPVEEERIAMGWDENPDFPFLKKYYKEPDVCKKLIMDADYVIFGGTDEESYIRQRLEAGRVVIRYSERIYKEGQWKAISPRGLYKKYMDHTKYRNKDVYLLCSGAYVPSDFHIVRAYPDKMFQWGYFPPVKTYEVPVMNYKRNDVIQIIWAGRMIDWKHPEVMIYLARALKKEHLNAHILMIGDGPLKKELETRILSEGLEKYIELPGFMKPDMVRLEMERSHIHLLTSDYREGWGAVLNESMNSGCAPVANCAVGAAPYLIRHGKNGFLYPNGDLDKMVDIVKKLIEDTALRERVGQNAYDTIVTEWNGNVAATRLLAFIEGLKRGENCIPDSGPMAKAKVIPQGKMYGECTK